MSDPTYNQLARLAEDRGVWAFYATGVAVVLAGILAWRCRK